jgi:hypothetical protein
MQATNGRYLTRQCEWVEKNTQACTAVMLTADGHILEGSLISTE